MSSLAIQIEDLKKSYNNLPALKGVNINISKGEFFGLLGPNGAGKTTTINILTGLVFKDHGNCLVFDKDIVKDYRYTRSKIGIAAQELSVDWFFTIEKLLYFQAGYYGISAEKAKRRIDELLDRLGLDKKRESRLRQLSGGMKRRFQIAKALVHDPEILILDEPTAGVDVELRHDLWKYLKELHHDGKTILLTTHYIEEAELLCENVAIIDEGKILKMGSPKKLTKELGNSGITVQIGQNINNVDIDHVLNDLNYTVEESRLHFSVKDPEKSISEIIQRLTKINVPLQSITTETSSLEDVFLDLTGKNINE
ncbi:MAG: ABC transporter ATP-binding protein [Candidatus Marinimicrobia bacterium]|nr:ABC transporter ATP-binding protein [Candidatus Neomarinimicrobiota bacterium]